MFVLIFRDFNPEIHDVYKVAELIYDVDYRTFKHVFKSKEEGVEAIKNRLLLIDFAKVQWRKRSAAFSSWRYKKSVQDP